MSSFCTHAQSPFVWQYSQPRHPLIFMFPTLNTLTLCPFASAPSLKASMCALVFALGRGLPFKTKIFIHKPPLVSSISSGRSKLPVTVQNYFTSGRTPKKTKSSSNSLTSEWLPILGKYATIPGSSSSFPSGVTSYALPLII